MIDLRLLFPGLAALFIQSYISAMEEYSSV